jgi:hypothetical protein
VSASHRVPAPPLVFAAAAGYVEAPRVDDRDVTHALLPLRREQQDSSRPLMEAASPPAAGAARRDRAPSSRDLPVGNPNWP